MSALMTELSWYLEYTDNLAIGSSPLNSSALTEFLKETLRK